MNPFDLPGPEFLVFYVLLAAIVGGLLYLYINITEGASRPARPIFDPYLIAGLRGGPREAARVGVFSLVDRGLIELNGDDLSVLPEKQEPPGLHPIERAIFRRCKDAINPRALPQDPQVYTACENACQPLVRLGLVLSPAQRAQWIALLVVAGVALVGTGLAKIVIAQERGHSNIGFLVLLCFAVVIACVAACRRARTAAGTRMSADLKRLLEGSRARSSELVPGASTSEAMLLAAAFGMAVLPAVSSFAELQRAYPRRRQSSSCGSSCGGGGGCGGGCGGCGGS